MTRRAHAHQPLGLTAVAATLVALLLLATLATGAAAHETAPADSPFANAHPHVLLLHADVDMQTPAAPFPYTVRSYSQCVDLAGGQALDNRAQHDTVHFGRAGAALKAAGHWVVPFVSCANVDAVFGITTGPS